MVRMSTSLKELMTLSIINKNPIYVLYKMERLL